MHQYTQLVKASTRSDRSDQDSKQSKFQKRQVTLKLQAEGIVLPNQSFEVRMFIMGIHGVER